MTPIAGAYIADTYWGRYKTVCVSVAIAMVGHVIMIISAIPGVIGSNASVGLFILSMIVTGAGTGGFKSNISPLVAEQYRQTKRFIRITKSGERVIVDPSLTTSRIYMVSYYLVHIEFNISICNIVLLSFHQHRGARWPDWNGLRGKGLITSFVPENDATDGLTFSFAVCRILASVYTSHMCIPYLALGSLVWTRQIPDLPPNRLGPSYCPSHLALCYSREMELEPDQSRPQLDRGRLLGECQTKQSGGRETEMDGVR